MAKEVTVLIGVAYNGKPIAGVVNQPFFEQSSSSSSDFSGRVLWGIVGLGNTPLFFLSSLDFEFLIFLKR